MMCIVPLVTLCASPTPRRLMCHVSFLLCNQSFNIHIKVQLEGIISRRVFIFPLLFGEENSLELLPQNREQNSLHTVRQDLSL